VATPAAYFRGGTSKGLIVRGDQVPVDDGPALAEWILAVFGSPDPRQIDGIGGGDMLTSKFAVVSPSTSPGHDVDYAFFQVGVDRAEVLRDAGCGNLASAVALFALQEGLAPRGEATGVVRIHDRNTNATIVAEVERPPDGGDATPAVTGVPATGAVVQVDFSGTVGSATGALLPTGSVRDVLSVPGVGAVEVSVVDVANLVAFVAADNVGVDLDASAVDLESDAELMARLGAIRASVAVRLGLASSHHGAEREAPGIPFQAVVGPGAQGATAPGHSVRARGMALGRIHRAYWATGAVCTGVAAALEGTIVHAAAGGPAPPGAPVRIAHPSGELEVTADVTGSVDGGFTVRRAALARTARRIMDGTVYAPRSRLTAPPPSRGG
jgi:2-methylaconitate cis-trans-isomerase PrpF